MRTPHMNQRSAGRICPMTAADLSGLQPSTGGTAHLLPFGASPLPAVSPEACPPPQYAALRTSDPINNSSISDTAHIIPRQSPPVNKSAPKRQGLRPVLALPRGISFLGESRRTEGAARRACRGFGGFAPFWHSRAALGLRPVLALSRGVGFLGESRRTEGAARCACRGVGASPRFGAPARRWLPWEVTPHGGCGAMRLPGHSDWR